MFEAQQTFPLHSRPIHELDKRDLQCTKTINAINLLDVAFCAQSSRQITQAGVGRHVLN